MEESILKIPQTLLEAVRHFSDPEAAWHFVKEMRWPGGAICPFCGHDKSSFCEPRKRWQCKSCRKQYTVKTGTIFHGSPLGLDVWLSGMWLITNARNGISSYELSRSLGISQPCAWFLAHRVRSMMETGTFLRLSGTVEVDETWVGGKPAAMHANRRTEMRRRGFPKVCVMGLKERGGQVRLRVIQNTKAETLQPAIRRFVKKGEMLYTDNARAYQGIEKDFDHHTVNHFAGQYVTGDVSCNSIDNVWSVMKRAYHGSHIHYSHQHAHRYVAETEFKMNHREYKDGARFAIAVSQVSGKRLTYRELVQGALQTMAE
jgi:transposase-like protein